MPLTQDEAEQIMLPTLETPQWGYTFIVSSLILMDAHKRLDGQEVCVWTYRHDLMRYICQHGHVVKALELQTNAGACRN